MSSVNVDEELEFNYGQYYGQPNWNVSAETIDHVCVSQGVHSQEINSFLGYNWDGERKLKCSKKGAERMAEELLKRDSPPLTSEFLQMLNLWKFKSNPYRKMSCRTMGNLSTVRILACHPPEIRSFQLQ